MIIVGIAWGIMAGSRPSIHQYRDNFGFSLVGLGVEIIAYEHVNAFQDPSAGYQVKLSGAIAGSDFDPAEMTEGISESVMQTISFFNGDLKAEGKDAFFVPDKDRSYSQRVFFSKDGRSRFIVVYDKKQEQYWMFWEG